MKQWSYLNSAVQLLTSYTGDQPFASFLKKYFSTNKKYGSRDRKEIAHLCYCFFRLGKACPHMPREERVLLALFLCSQHSHDVLEKLRPEWNEKVALDPAEKVRIVEADFSFDDIMPWTGSVSRGIDVIAFNRSFLVQPDLFIRVRPGKEAGVLSKLHQAGIAFHEWSPSCIILPVNTRIEDSLKINEEIVVQDLSSQGVAEYFPALAGRESVWDCCAASGGKSIMLYDKHPGIRLWVSDIRESILANLRQRFGEAGIRKFNFFVADLSNAGATLNIPAMDLIIADVPCTGSGTWGRTPEQLFFFTEEKIKDYAILQRKIVSTAIAHLKPGGYFLYITCSVFKQENEDAIDHILQLFPVEVIKMGLLKGYDRKADTLFAALLRKPL